VPHRNAWSGMLFRSGGHDGDRAEPRHGYAMPATVGHHHMLLNGVKPGAPGGLCPGLARCRLTSRASAVWPRSSLPETNACTWILPVTVRWRIHARPKRTFNTRLRRGPTGRPSRTAKLPVRWRKFVRLLRIGIHDYAQVDSQRIGDAFSAHSRPRNIG